MDCQQIRQMIAAGEEGRLIVRRHLHRCGECLAFRQQLYKTETMLSSGLLLAAPDALTQRLLATVPRAAERLCVQAADQDWARERVQQLRARWSVYGLLVLGVLLGVIFWQQMLRLLRPAFEQVVELLPLIPQALSYWGGRLIGALAPFLDALQAIALFAIMALVAEYVLRTVRARSETEAH